MGLYITQGNYTESAIKGMIQNPEDRATAVAALMEAVGAKMLQYYVTLGEYDFMVITEGDDTNEAMLAGLMVAGSSGGTCNLKTIRAFTSQEAKSAMEKAGKVVAGFSPAGK
ncbi:GYD domain-containing protein [Candidatus Colwellia aromaticivorans]|uniref:GYD domain-containing protein n=1 Tax=Candidatus Colwellia aromaticivorans TaxID=2267621 RepID=UPI000DF32CB6|nr:GYD domain-containing protein [Candidatus Colwellia aromaticivorans]